MLEEEDITLEEVGVGDLSQVLIEVRNKDLTWPEEMSQITSTKVMRTQSRQGSYVTFFTDVFRVLSFGLLSGCLFITGDKGVNCYLF